MGAPHDDGDDDDGKMKELNPGKMEVVEVGRQGEPIVFDNDQEIITAPQIVKNSKNSFSVDVKASFAPQSSRGRGQVRRQGKQQGPLVRRVERRRGGELCIFITRIILNIVLIFILILRCASAQSCPVEKGTKSGLGAS